MTLRDARTEVNIASYNALLHREDSFPHYFIALDDWDSPALSAFQDDLSIM
jgi:hypothetical protein